MAHSETCPLCGGSGKLKLAGGKPAEQEDIFAKTCHGCGGQGWVTVQDKSHYPITERTPLDFLRERNRL